MVQSGWMVKPLTTKKSQTNTTKTPKKFSVLVRVYFSSEIWDTWVDSCAKCVLFCLFNSLKINICPFFSENNSHLNNIILFIHDLAYLASRLHDMQVHYREKNKREAANNNIMLLGTLNRRMKGSQKQQVYVVASSVDMDNWSPADI